MTNIILQPVDIERDLNFIYENMLSEDLYLFSSVIVLNTKKDFAEWLNVRLHNEFHDFYMVDLDGSSIGFVYNYDFSLINGHCKIVTYINKEKRSTGAGGIASVIFIKKLFEAYPIHKIYTTVYDYNEQSISSNLKAGFKKEGYLNEFRYYKGSYHGLYILSMTRRTFFETLGKVIR